MKLNVRSESTRSESNLSHGVTAVVTTPRIANATVSTTSRSPSPHTHILSAGTQTDPPPTWRPTPGAVYLVGVLLLLFLPLALPVVMTQAVRVFEKPDKALYESLQHAFRRAFLREAVGGTQELEKERLKTSVREREEDWSRWAVVRNGRLYISETFENRLNQHAGHVYAKIGRKFRGRCKGEMEFGFALNTGERIRGWVEVTMKCGYGTCVRKARVEDIRRLVVSVDKGKHYVSAGIRTWGPIRGPLRVGLDGDGVLGMRRICESGVERVAIGVRELREMLGEGIDVFRFGAR